MYCIMRIFCGINVWVWVVNVSIIFVNRQIIKASLVHLIIINFLSCCDSGIIRIFFGYFANDLLNAYMHNSFS